MGCCGNRGKDEYVAPEQKWEYINLDNFKSRSCGLSQSAYVFFFIGIIFSIAGYAADTYTAVNLLIFNRWSSKVKPAIPFQYSKWIFAGCIIASFVLLAFEIFRAVRVIKSRSISRGYLNIIAQRWWSFGGQGWKRFLVFAALTKSKHGADYVMLFSYFAFKGWARIIFTDGPRQVLNAITLYAVLQAKLIKDVDKNGFSKLLANIKELEQESTTQAVILCTMLFTLVIWVFSVLRLILASLLWMLFLWHHVPPGLSLSDYCREKIDKRLRGIVQKKHKKILQREQMERSKNEKQGNLQKPTLPVLETNPPFLQQNNTSVSSFSSQKPMLHDLKIPSNVYQSSVSSGRPGMNSRSSTTFTDVSMVSTTVTGGMGGGRDADGRPLLGRSGSSSTAPYSRQNTPFSADGRSQTPQSAVPFDFLGNNSNGPMFLPETTMSPVNMNRVQSPAPRGNTPLNGNNGGGSIPPIRSLSNNRGPGGPGYPQHGPMRTQSPAPSVGGFPFDNRSGTPANDPYAMNHHGGDIIPRTRTPPTARSATAPINNSNAYAPRTYTPAPQDEVSPYRPLGRARTFDEETGVELGYMPPRSGTAPPPNNMPQQQFRSQSPGPQQYQQQQQQPNPYQRSASPAHSLRSQPSVSNRQPGVQQMSRGNGMPSRLQEVELDAGLGAGNNFYRPPRIPSPQPPMQQPPQQQYINNDAYDAGFNNGYGNDNINNGGGYAQQPSGGIQAPQRPGTSNGYRQPAWGNTQDPINRPGTAGPSTAGPGWENY